jgi:hypothetical protein
MKYIKQFEKFRNEKNIEKVNEEIFGPIVNFFKGLWQKAVDEIKKLGKNPSVDQVEEWIDKNPMNPQDDTYVFKGVMDEFTKLQETNVNDQTCLDLIKNILDPQVGCLGKQGLQPLYDNIIKAFGNDTPTIDIIKFAFETIRNRAIKDYKYAGGPDLKVGTDARVDDKKIFIDVKTDSPHLPDFKKVLAGAGQDNKKKKQLTIDWVNKTLVPRLDKYLSEIKNEQIDKYLETVGKEAPEAGPEGGYKTGDNVIYKREKFVEDEWKKITDAEKLKPNEGKMKELQDKEMIGIKDIKEVKGDDISFEKGDGTLFTKKIDEILGKVEGVKPEGQEDLVKKLGELKTKKPEDIKKVSQYVDFISDEKNKDKIVELDKIINAGEGA